MVLNEVGLECEVHVDRICLDQVSEFKYLGCILDESGTDGAEFSRKVVMREVSRQGRTSRQKRFVYLPNVVVSLSLSLSQVFL